MQKPFFNQFSGFFSGKRFKFLVLLSALLFIVLFLRNMGMLLTSEQKAVSSDLMFILLGPVPERALWAAELFHTGKAKQILMANEYQAGLDAAMAERLHIDKTADVFYKALLSLEVPETSIHTLPDVAGSTRDEALILLNYLEQHTEIQSVIIVTSSYHNLRAQKLMAKALKNLDRKVTFCVPHNPHSVFNAKKWWTDRFSATMVALEYLKLVNYYVSDQFTL